MRRAGAGERYFFGAAYFDRILESPTAPGSPSPSPPTATVAAASIAARSDGFLHYYLSGSADSHLRDSPMKNVVAALVELAAELGLPLNLGGGLSRGDRLEEFKRGFANREQPWRTSELVCDPPPTRASQPAATPAASSPPTGAARLAPERLRFRASSGSGR